MLASTSSGMTSVRSNMSLPELHILDKSFESLHSGACEVLSTRLIPGRSGVICHNDRCVWKIARWLG